MGLERGVDTLRISVTDRCSLRCIYCMPEKGLRLVRASEILSFEEIVLLVRALAFWGVKKLKLTGGEPLVRREIERLIKMLSEVKAISDIAMTTNGLFLSRYAALLKDSGLKRVTISLDTLRPERFKTITRRDGFFEVMRGIEEAKKQGLEPVKINVVVIRGINDDELVEFANFSKQEELEVRFIEFMPFKSGMYGACKEGYFRQSSLVSGGEILEKLQDEFGEFHKVERAVNEIPGPAKVYKFMNGKIRIGLITPISEPFCETCSRLRLSSDGKLISCLYSNDAFDLKRFLRKPGSDEDGLFRAIQETIEEKQNRTYKRVQSELSDGLYRIGG